MKKLLIAAIAIGCTLAATASFAAPGDDFQIATLVQEMQGMNSSQLATLEPIEVVPYTLPEAGVDVMRVRLQETYEIEGVGEDTVQLTGWIAVRHNAPRLAPGEQEIAWGSAIVDTQFLALELDGNSEIFGPVHVSLDKSRPAYGQVGKIEIPTAARVALASLGEENSLDAGDLTKVKAECAAPTNAVVSMPQLGIEMKTAEPAVWHSRVTTIPPVGQQASVTIEPVSLVTADGRQAGTLVSGKITFREVVRKVNLQGQGSNTVAAADD